MKTKTVPIKSPLVSSVDYHENVKQATMAGEFSMSHCLRNESKLLGGRTYGECLGRFIVSRGLVDPTSSIALEVGGGLCHVAKKLLPVLRSTSPKLEYVMLELSPNLEAEQIIATRDIENVRHIRGDAHNISQLLNENGLFGVDFVLANECIGDLTGVSCVPFRRGGNPSGPNRGRLRSSFTADLQSDWDVAWDLIERYGLPVPDPRQVENFVVPVGQIAFVEQLVKVLKPGGAAVLIEHSSEYPMLVDFVDHTEVSMSRGYLGNVAVRKGLRVEFGRLIDLLGVDPKAKVVNLLWVNYVHAFGMDWETHLGILNENYYRARESLDGNVLPDYPMEEKVTEEFKRRKLSESRGCDLIRRLIPPEQVRENLWGEKMRDRNNIVYDLFLTPHEFWKHCEKMRWSTPLFEKPRTVRAREELKDFSFMILRKPHLDVSPKDV